MSFLLASIVCIRIVAAGRPMTEAELAGREIYWRGVGVTALLNKGETELPAEGFTCAGCHGPEGEGGVEAGLRVPPIAWSALSAATRNRPVYQEAHLERAILAGFDAGGRKLSASMPLYRMTREQARAVSAYLKIAGTAVDSPPGVGDDEIRFGAVLPLTGPPAERGRLIQASVEAHFATVNASGGIFGRRLTLVTADAATDAPAAARRLAASGVFAMLASLGATPIGGLVAGTAALVGPITAGEVNGAGEPAVFPVMPSVGTQASVLAQRLLRSNAVVAITQAEGPLYSAAARAFQSHLPAAAVKPATSGWAVYFGPPSGWRTFRASLPAGVRTATLAMMVQGDLLPDLLVSPFSGEPPAALRAALGGRADSPLAAWAWASASVAAEACRRSGRRLSPRVFREALETFRDFPTAASAPVTYTQQRHTGASGAFLFEFPAGSRVAAQPAYLTAPEPARELSTR